MKAGKEWLGMCECGVECRYKRRHPEIGTCPAPRQELGRSSDRYSMGLQQGKGVGNEWATVGCELEVEVFMSLRMGIEYENGHLPER